MKGAWWLIVYLPVIAFVSWAGSKTFGGRDYIPYGYDLALVAVIGAIFYFWGIATGWRTPMVEAARFHHDDLEPGEPDLPPSADEAEKITGHR